MNRVVRTEIQYVIPDFAENQDDLEQVITAIRAYENELDGKSEPDATIHQVGDSTAIIGLSRLVFDRRTRAQLLHDTEVMRVGVEKHFSDADRERLSSRFAGVVLPNDLETE